MGHGVNITPKSKDPRIWKLWQNFWASPENNMNVRQFEIVKRWIRDGEVFIRKFSTDVGGNKVPFMTVRFMDPIDVQHGAGEGQSGVDTDKTNQGIVYDPNDAEKPLYYWMKDRNNTALEHKIPAPEVIHVKYPVADMDQARGESALQSIMDLFTHYRQWLKNRIILNKLRTAIFAVRKIDIQSGQGVQQLQQSLPTSGRDASGGSKKMNIKPGTLYTPPPGVDIDMRAANINASDVKEDGRNIILQMCAGSGLPEFMYGDASNANYSSTMMAESPFVKKIHFLQAYLEACLWRPLFRMVVQTAVDAGKLTAPAEEDIFAIGPEGEQDLNEAGEKPGDMAEKDSANAAPAAGADKKPAAPQEASKDSPISETELELFYGCDVEWPEVIHREPKDQTDALVMARNEGWISDKTASEKLGFDYAEEVRKQQQIEEQAEKEGNPLLNHAQGDMNAVGEEQNGIDQQNKEMDMAGAGKGGANKPPFGKSGAAAGGE